ncbi:uncharacterized protein LOC111914987 [Lactuca sativa]|uniref:uncharacterized protein LOC111914987 n=1 Tax=Lactuca sativa TaxID=4236 RepID=UPI000CD9E9A7|nr:uncharacterized protein LOC111914987 [Lactuca sativa]
MFPFHDIKTPQRPNRRNNTTLTPPEIKSAAFQAVVSDAVTAALAQIHNGNNGASNGQGARSTNQGTNQGSTRTCTYKDFTNTKPRTFNRTGGIITLKRWTEKVESMFEICGCPEECKVKLAACTFINQALSWWNGHVEAMTLPLANAMLWEELKEILLVEYCPRVEIKKMQQELWNLTVQNSDIDAYVSRFSELSLLCPGMITSEGKKIESAKRLAKKLYDHGNKKGAKAGEAEVKKEGDKKKSLSNQQKGRQNTESSK